MKKRRLKIKAGLFLSLVLIIGILSVLYAVFCKGKGYNHAKVELPTAAVSVPDAPAESETQPVTQEVPTETSTVAPEESTTEEPTSENTTAALPVASANYNPMEILAGENWNLALISAKYPLNKSYSPTLAPVIDGSAVTVDSRITDSYKSMYNDALASGLVLTPYSGYCSFQRQQTVFDNKVDAFMLQGMTRDEAKLNAEKRIGQSGCSENNAGLAVDIISASAGFSSSNEYKWLTENAYKYGFVLRYPDDKTGITGMIYQPWHWRYVGTEAATQMKEKNQCLEEYLGFAAQS